MSTIYLEAKRTMPIKARILTAPDQIKILLPACRQLAEQSGCVLPFQSLEQPLLWWQHFNSTDGDEFGRKRGRNFFGTRSWFEKIYLAVVEMDDKLVAYAPFVGSCVSVRSQKEPVRLLNFCADSVLFFYHDLTVDPTIREAAVATMLASLTEIIQKENRILFLGHIPEKSENLSCLRKVLLDGLPAGMKGGMAKIQSRGGIYPWTIPDLKKSLKQIADNGHAQPLVKNRIVDLLTTLNRLNSSLIMFPGTRQKLENTLHDILETHAGELGDDAERTLGDAIAAQDIKYPYLELPESIDTFSRSLSASNRYYFKRYMRKLHEAGGSIEKILPQGLTEQDIDDYLQLHLSRWGNESVAVNESTKSFHVELAQKLAQRGHLQMFFAKLGDKRVAAHACIDIGDRREYYFSGRLLDASNLPIGKLLCYQTVIDAIETGMAFYDFGYGGDEYKSVFTNTAQTLRCLLLSPEDYAYDVNELLPKYEQITFEMPG